MTAFLLELSFTLLAKMDFPACRSTIWYLRFSRIFAVFPIRMALTPNGCAIFFISRLLATVFTILALAYSISILDFFCATLGNKKLSFVLTVAPSTLAVMVAHDVIVASAILCGPEFIELVKLTNRHSFPVVGSTFFSKFFVVVAVLNSLLALMRIVGIGLVQTANVPSAIALKIGGNWDRVIGAWMNFADFLHDGLSLSALCFVVIFGRRMVACAEMFCKGILDKCCIVAHARWTTTMPVCLEEGKRPAILLNEQRDEWIKEFEELKRGFEIYTKIAGALIFALTIAMGAWIFFSASYLLFPRDEVRTLSYEYIVATFMCPVVFLNLVTISELGHQMGSQLTSMQETLRDLRVKLHLREGEEVSASCVDNLSCLGDRKIM